MIEKEKQREEAGWKMPPKGAQRLLYVLQKVGDINIGSEDRKKGTKAKMTDTKD